MNGLIIFDIRTLFEDFDQEIEANSVQRDVN